MSLLDDARILLDESPPDWCASTREWVCGFCYVRLFDPTDDDDDDSAIYESFEHNPECSWLSLPKIVAVLEAAERYVSLNGRDDVSMTDLMHAEDDLHAAFGHARRYDVEEIKT